jgi:hypothetical protein
MRNEAGSVCPWCGMLSSHQTSVCCEAKTPRPATPYVGFLFRCYSDPDLDGRVRRFPKMQAAGGPEVIVPLHDGLLGVLSRAAALGRGDRTGWVFPNPLDLNSPYSMHAAQHVPEEFGYEIRMRDFVRVHAYWAEREPEAAGGLPAWYDHLRNVNGVVLE